MQLKATERALESYRQPQLSSNPNGRSIDTTPALLHVHCRFILRPYVFDAFGPAEWTEGPPPFLSFRFEERSPVEDPEDEF